MRVLFLAGYQHPAAHRKVEVLADAPDVELLHLTYPDSGLADGPHPSVSGARHYTTQTVPIRWLGQVGDPHRVVLRSSLRVLRDFRPDIIHCEQEQEGLMAAQVALARAIFARGTPLILYSWQNIIRRRSLPVLAVARYTLAAAQHILCASHEAADILRRQGFRGSTSVSPMYGLDTRFFHRRVEARAALRQSHHLRDTGCLVGYVGRLVPEKGIADLLHAAAQTPTVHLWIVGDGPEATPLHRLAEELGLTARCTFLPAVPLDRVADVMSALDVLVLPSHTTPHWKEQFGRVLVEAMACEVAVVGADSGAIPEVIGAGGRVYPEGDRAALAAILGELAAQPDQRAALAAQGRVQTLRRYAIERLAADILQVWRTLSRSHPA